MKKVNLGIVLVLLLIISFTVLLKENTDEESSKELDENSKKVIGLSMDTMVIERWQKDRDILTAKAKESGYDVITLNANEDMERQRNQIKYLIDKKVDVIVIIPSEKDGLETVIEEAKRKGIIVIAYDRLIMNANVDAYVSFDNVKVGEYMASYLLSKVPSGNYVIINGSTYDNNSIMFNQGYKNILEEHIENGDVSIVEEVWADYWREDIASQTVNEVLERGNEVNGIIGANDRLAEDAISVLTENGLAGEVFVVGHDADISACQRIVEGTQLMTVYKPIKHLAEGTVELINKMLESKEFESNEYINDGKYDIPYIKFDVIPVNNDNMKETVIKDGFHNEEDVYRNIHSR